MRRTFTYPITESEAGMSILSFLKSRQYSSQMVAHLKRTSDGICRNGVWARVRDTLSDGDILTIQLVEEASSEHIVPVPLPFDIVYEDEDLMVVNKPARMPIHPSQGNYDNTLANAAAYYFASRNLPFTYRCINRLDRDTTGLLILAKHGYSAALLSSMVAGREIHREYLAVVQGMTEAEGTIEAPIARVEGSTIERGVDFVRGDYACTHYRRLLYIAPSAGPCTGHSAGQTSPPEAPSSALSSDTPSELQGRKNGYSLLSVHLETGRTHQIRVHFKYIGHPLPGDFLYCPDDTVIDRQALHSHRLSFLHPITRQKMDFEAPLPEDMRRIFSRGTDA